MPGIGHGHAPAIDQLLVAPAIDPVADPRPGQLLDPVADPRRLPDPIGCEIAAAMRLPPMLQTWLVPLEFHPKRKYFGTCLRKKKVNQALDMF